MGQQCNSKCASNDNMTVIRCSNGVFTAAGPCAGCLSIISDTNIGYKTHSSHYIFITMDRPAAVPRTAAEQHPRFVDVWSCKVCKTQLYTVPLLICNKTFPNIHHPSGFELNVKVDFNSLGWVLIKAVAGWHQIGSLTLLLLHFAATLSPSFQRIFASPR